MNGQERRKQIIAYILQSKTPVSGTKLAEMFEVSRQVIVQDIALIRANGCDIFSTNRGYIIQGTQTATRLFWVNHSDEELEDELCTIVDMGGKVKNVIVEHGVYGKLEAPLDIASRRRVYEFVKEIRESKSGPLKNITSGDHAHLVEAEDETVLKLIEDHLEKKGYLVKCRMGGNG